MITVMNYIYFYLFSFLRTAPRKEYASGWAAAFTPLFFVTNALAILYSFDILFSIRIPIVGEKAVVGIIAFCWSALMYYRYELIGRGKNVIVALSRPGTERKNVIVGGIIFFETLCGGLLPGIIAVIKNPSP